MTQDIASLGIKVDTQDLSRGTAALSSFTGAGQQAEAATGKLAGTTGLLGRAVFVAAGSYALLKMSQYVQEATLLNARYQTLAAAMTTVGRNAGYTSSQMESAAIAMQKTGISMLESRNQALRLVQAHIDLTQASKLARIAQDAAVIGNINSSEAFSRLVHGIQSGQTEVLRTIGINVTMERSYKEMAKTLGVNVDQLTQAQRAQSVLNSVIREGATIAGAYEAAMGTASKQILSMERYTENLKLQLGETFNEALTIAVMAVTDSFKNMSEEAQQLAQEGQLKAWGRDAITTFVVVGDLAHAVFVGIKELVQEITYLGQATNLIVHGQFSALGDLTKARAAEGRANLESYGSLMKASREYFDLKDKEIAGTKAATSVLNEYSAAAKKGIGSAAHIDATEKLLVMWGMGKLNLQQLNSALADVNVTTKVATVATADNADATKKNAEAYKNLVQSIQEKIATNQLELSGQIALSEAQKMSIQIKSDIASGDLVLTANKQAQVAADLLALDATEQLVTSMQWVKRAGDDLISSSTQQIASLQSQIDTQRQANAEIGMTTDQIYAMVGAKEMEEAANVRAAAQYAGPLHDAYIQYANDLEMIAGKERELASEKQIAANAAEWARIGTTIEQTGKMAFVQFAAHGKNAMKSIGQALKLSIVDLLYQMTVRPWILRIGASFMGMFGATAANAFGSSLFGSATGLVSGATGVGAAAGPGGSGVSMTELMGEALSGIKSLASMVTGFTGNITGSVIGTGIQSLGSFFGSSAATAFGAGLATSGTELAAAAGAQAIWGTTGAAAGAASMGMELALILDPLTIAVAAVDIGLRLLVGDLRIGGTFGKIINFMPVIGPILSGLFGRGPPKPIGPQQLVGTYSEAGFEGDLQTPWRMKGGLFRKNKYGAWHQNIPPELQSVLDAAVVSQASVFQGLIITAGEATRSLSGWSMAVRRTIQTDEQWVKLMLDLSESLGAHLVPELKAVQQKGETLADTAKRMRGEFILTNEILYMTGQTFSELGLKSMAARDNLVQLFGGSDKAGSSMQSYYSNFYTDAERNASGWKILHDEMSKLGLTSLPTTMEQFRKLVEAQDLNTASGQGLFASLVQLSPIFAELSKGSAALASNAQQAVASLTELTTASFKTLLDYTRYTRLRSNMLNALGSTAGSAPGFFGTPGFASGGDFAGGLRWVGEEGPELEVTGPSRIISNQEIMGGSNEGVISELRALRSEVASLRNASEKTAYNAKKTNDILFRVTRDGDSLVTVAA